MAEPRDYSLLHAVEMIRRRKLSCHELVVSCLERIEARQPDVRAWVTVQAEQAMELAMEMDREVSKNRWRGPLHGIPLGIKDIIDVQGIETKGGTEAHPAHTPNIDATCVARLRDAGAIILGKLTTTPFAFRDPSEARNPWDLSRSPGGSSAGSGAAVADRMCMGALGTQTGGSVLRPAAYNGVVGFKPTYGTIPTDGVIPLSWQFDHVGVLARNVEDTHLLWEILRRSGGDWQTNAERMVASHKPHAPLTVWRVRGFFEREADPEVLVSLEEACLKLEQNGVRVIEKPLPEGIENFEAAYMPIHNADAAAYHEPNFQENKHRYPTFISETIESGRAVKAVDYVKCLQTKERLRVAMVEAMQGVDIALMPTTPTPPPDPSTTGSPRFNSPWSMLGLPAISLPSGLSEAGLPLGVQLVATQGGDKKLLQVAGWVESRLGFSAKPA